MGWSIAELLSALKARFPPIVVPLLWLAFLFAVPGVTGQTALAQSAILGANELSFDQSTGIYTAIGGVEAHSEGNAFVADRARYFSKQRVFQAEGNIAYFDPEGVVWYGEALQLDRSFGNGFVKRMSAQLNKDDKLSAAWGEVEDGKTVNLYNASFSPCPLCRDDPQKPLAWEVRASQVTYDTEKDRVYFQNPELVVLGRPIIGLPSFGHSLGPDAERIQRTTGILRPTIQAGTRLGTTLGLPLFVVLGDDKDLRVDFQTHIGPNEVFIPFDGIGGLPELGGVTAKARYRQAFNSANVTVDGAVTWENSNTYLDEVLSGTGDENLKAWGQIQGNWFIDENWKASGNYMLTSDREYPYLMDFGVGTQYNNSAQLEGFLERSYVRAEIEDFVSNLNSLEPEEGFFAERQPELYFDYQSEPLGSGLKARAEGSARRIYREHGQNQLKTDLHLSALQPLRTSSGQLFRFVLGGAMAFSYNSDVDPASLDITGQNANLFTGAVSTAHVYGQTAWSYPLINKFDNGSQIIEPELALTITSADNNSAKVANEDSYDIEFDTTHLLSPWRTQGTDAYDTGSRLDYRLNWKYRNDNGVHLAASGGQSIRLDSDVGPWFEGSGLEKQLSDFVASFNAGYRSFYMDAGARYDFQDTKLERLYVRSGKSITDSRMGFDLTYRHVEPNARNDGQVRFVDGSLSLRWGEYTIHSLEFSQNLVNRDERSLIYKVNYDDPCWDFEFYAGRKWDTSGEATTVYGFDISLKYLGGLSYGLE